MIFLRKIFLTIPLLFSKVFRTNFLKIMNISEEEFMEIALKHQISPWQYEATAVTDGKKLHDQDSWEDTPIR